MSKNLKEKSCEPCEGGVDPFTQEEAEEYLEEVEGWELSEDGNKIKKSYGFDDFKRSMMFVNQVANVAESEAHHPDIYISYDSVELELWTHSIDGLSENDFIVASKVDDLS